MIEEKKNKSRRARGSAVGARGSDNRVGHRQPSVSLSLSLSFDRIGDPFFSDSSPHFILLATWKKNLFRMTIT